MSNTCKLIVSLLLPIILFVRNTECAAYSCNEAGLSSAVLEGGSATFSCGIGTIINLKSKLQITKDISIDGDYSLVITTQQGGTPLITVAGNVHEVIFSRLALIGTNLVVDGAGIIMIGGVNSGPRITFYQCRLLTDGYVYYPILVSNSPSVTIQIQNSYYSSNNDQIHSVVKFHATTNGSVIVTSSTATGTSTTPIFIKFSADSGGQVNITRSTIAFFRQFVVGETPDTVQITKIDNSILSNGNYEGAVAFVVGSIISEGYNIIYTNDTSFFSLLASPDTNNVGYDPQLIVPPVLFNNSYTQVFRLNPCSIAVNTARNAIGYGDPLTDQLGTVYPEGEGDIGAFEDTAVGSCLNCTCGDFHECGIVRNDSCSPVDCGACQQGYDCISNVCDFNECESGNNNCSANATCTNTIGSFTCHCNTSFFGDGVDCYDYCLNGNGGCDALTTCTAHPDGSTTCTNCPANYLGSGKTGCYYDFCSDSNGGCDAQTNCTVYPNGTTSCSNCPTNYLGTGKTGCYYNYCRDSNGGCDVLTTCTVYLNGTTSCSNCPTSYLGTGKAGCYYDYCLNSNGGCDAHTTCTAYSNGTTSCSNCPANYLGTGNTGCYYNICLDNNGGCDAQTSCTAYPNGTTSCSNCPTNYLGTGKTGCYYNYCIDSNGGCDPLTTCSTYSNGTTTCSDCPTNYLGAGNTGCYYNPFCGDGICYHELENCIRCPEDCPKPCGLCGDQYCNDTGLETCLTCHQDCGLACGLCGDSVCDEGENCTSCAQDCGTCRNRTCPGEGDCNKNGECVAGVCKCKGNWVGLTCNTENMAIVVIPSSTVPIVSISVPQLTSNGAIAGPAFSTSVGTISEIDRAGSIIDSYELSEQNFRLDTEITESYTLSTYYTNLNNSAEVVMDFYFYNESVSFDFAGQQVTIAPQTLKLTLTVFSWPFESITHSLRIVFKTLVYAGVPRENNVCGVSDTNYDGLGNFHSIQIPISGNSAVYAQYLPRVLVDSVPRTATTILDSQNSSVVVIAPHFWEQLVVDPNFSVLVDPLSPDNECDEVDQSITAPGWKIATIVGCSVVAVALLVFVVIKVVLPKLELSKAIKKADKTLGGTEMHSKP